MQSEAVAAAKSGEASEFRNPLSDFKSSLVRAPAPGGAGTLVRKAEVARVGRQPAFDQCRGGAGDGERRGATGRIELARAARQVREIGGGTAEHDGGVTLPATR